MELLAPAGSWEAFLAAVENGADAVYIGGKNFSARQNAENFSEEQIKSAVEIAHFRGRKIYVTVNILIDNREFEAALDYIWDLYNYGVDAVIVQDLGLMKAIRSLIPGMRVHASTQMTIHNSQGAEFLYNEGVKRVVLSRELSLEDLALIRRQAKEIELEIFVHGALCYSYSGQCLFSSLVGGRSGNRGRCAQPCRLPYQLYSCRNKSPVITREAGKYLLSPSDLCLIDNLSQLQELDIDSLKIEGRMKRPEYVAIATRSYREALDLLESCPDHLPPQQVKEDLLKIFNRNFCTGYLITNKAEFLSTKRPNNRGVYVGRVVEQDGDDFTRIKLSETVSLGDGLEIWVAKGKNPAFTVNQIKVEGKMVSRAEKGKIITLTVKGRVSPNDRVFKTHDEQLMASALIKEDQHRIAIDIEAYLYPGQPLKLIFKDDKGNQAEACTRSLAEQAQTHPLDKTSLLEKINRLGNTPFMLRNFTLFSEGELLIPFSEINQARRQASEQLARCYLYRGDKPGLETEFRQLKAGFLAQKTNTVKPAEFPVLSVVVSSVEAARAAVQAGAERIYIGLEGVSQHKRVNVGGLKELINHSKLDKVEIVPALPRIQKPGEEKHWEILKDIGADSLLVGNPGALKWAQDRGISIRADYSLNIFNQYTLRYLRQMGVKSACLSPELNFTQMRLFKNSPVEIVVHGDIIIMVSQFCMLSGVLGPYEAKCSGFCMKDSYYLKDEKGYEFPVETDAYCRFYLFNSRTLCLMEELGNILALKPESVRIEARCSEAEEVGKMVGLYRKALDQLKLGRKPDLAKYKQQFTGFFTRGHFNRGVL